MIYDLIIIGGGPAGTAATVYAARKQLKALLITETFGGQSIVSDGIENWIGDIKIPGIELAKKFETHARAYAGEFVTIVTGKRVEKVAKKDAHFVVTTSKDSYEAKAVLVATGSNRRKIEAVNADKFEHKGLTYCASCDGPLFRDQDVVVLGGGNSAFESAAQLLAYAKSVTLMHRRDEFRADPVTVEALQKQPHFKILTNVEVTEVHGDFMVNGLTYKNNKTGDTVKMPVGGIFVEIGAVPAIGFVKDLVAVNEHGTIVIDPWSQKTSVEGIWAAGDCTNILYHQNNIAAGDAVRALEDIYVWLKTK